ncbi:hypothetical protein PsYK624_136950 [Phanerochaete sordida]|uniref:F-box domain-containing protein n=1 Tax=Phanerochaete sordida TaxID=48140 RepID=A0A9P3GQ82_9APHY|nr:hypothetical protein PsYK624_136950 [Phanerochaete sordida]
MHRCLCIAEVVQAIASSIWPRSDLVSMGLTCQAFLYPAMNEVWRYLPNPSSLILLLPEHTRESGPENKLKIVKAPSHADWRRFELYARRVWELEYRLHDDDGNSYLDVDWTSVLHHYPGKTLLPNLRELVIHRSITSSFCSLFIQPPLRHLSLESLDDEEAAVVVPHLHKCASTLEILVMQGRSLENAATFDDISRAISHLGALTDLYADKLLAATIEHLSRLSSIKVMYFTLDDTTFDEAKLPFSLLERLYVRSSARDTGPVVSFLRRVELPQLRHLTVLHSAQDNDVLPREYLTAVDVSTLLSAAAAFPNIRSIAYEDFRRVRAPPPPVSICRAEVLRPLHALSSLETLKLSRIPFILAPHDIDVLAQTWPRLRVLFLGHDVDHAHCAIHVHDLLPFALHSPTLDSLGLPLLIRKTSPGTVARPAFGTLRSQLRLLAIAGVELEYSADTAAFLACAFPEARLLVSPNNRTDAFIALSRTKDTMVEMMREALALRDEAA